MILFAHAVVYLQVVFYVPEMPTNDLFYSTYSWATPGGLNSDRGSQVVGIFYAVIILQRNRPYEKTVFDSRLGP